MYKAKAEIVKGAQVYADGKWLTCIGNKPVSVGDWIYTDGRCVYGYHKKSTSPLVITNEIFAIPICFEDQLSYTKHTITLANYKNGLSIIKAIEDKYYLLINDYNGNVYLSDDSWLMAANIDRQGNLYRIFGARQWIGDVNRKSSYEEPINAPKYLIRILKNNSVVRELDLTAYLQAAIDSAESLLPNPYGDTLMISVKRAFIENETNWHLVIDFIAIAHSSWVIDNYIENPSLEEYFSHESSSRQSAYSVNFYYLDAITSPKLIYSGYMRVSSSELLIIGEVLNPEYPDLAYQDTVSLDTSIIYPVQDGYYFKLGAVYSHNTEYYGEPMITSRNIYSPKGNLIYSGYFPTYADLTISQLSGGKYLVGVAELYLAAISHGSGTLQYPDPFIFSGLYILENGVMRDITPYRTGTAGDLYQACLNQRLRPMKNFKNWTDNIFILDEVIL